ncbi:MAG: class II aldolase, partial [Spirochaetales bacterium]|nr:class II aldolase [Spirochaetales bacterium]
VSKKIEDEVLDALPSDMKWFVKGAVNEDILAFLDDLEAFKPLELSFTPDHIVYCGFKPLYCESISQLPSEMKDYINKYGIAPKLVAIKGKGIFGIGQSLKSAELAKEVFFDDIKIAVYSCSFGGYSFMKEDKIDFIRNWEVEKYRSSVSGG